jgi:predicted TIM-barrel enzyme
MMPTSKPSTASREGRAAVRFVETLAGSRAAVSEAEVTVLCPWLKGLSPTTGVWVSALPIHDVNGFVDSDEPLMPAKKPRIPYYLGIFTLDRFRSPERLLARLRAKGVDGIINVPSVSFFDGRSTSILDSLDFGYEREVDFLRRAKLSGFRVALCGRRDALAAIEDLEAFDVVLCHDGPKSAFELFWKTGKGEAS